jgi:hypothetical protein
VIVESKVVGQSRLGEQDVELPAEEATTLRRVIEQLVTDEVEHYEQRQEQNALLRVMTQADLAEGHRSGRYSAGPRAPRHAPPLEQALLRALEAFEDELYLVFVDGRQIRQLDEPLTLRSDSRMQLIRLVALAGG